MSRYKHKEWQNKRPGWTHRVTWYEANRNQSLKLKFDTPEGISYLYFDDPEQAQLVYDAFKEKHA